MITQINFYRCNLVLISVIREIDVFHRNLSSQRIAVDKKGKKIPSNISYYCMIKGISKNYKYLFEYTSVFIFCQEKNIIFYN
jgi:hypothetical protein